MKKKSLPPTYFLVSLLLLTGTHFLFPIKNLIKFPYNLSGLLLIVFGAIINLWADSLFKKRKTTVKPEEKPIALITSGPFRFSRHPMYLGMAAILFGTSILLGSLTSFIFPIIFIILMQTKFIPLEEKSLEVEFGENYQDYKSKVRPWI